MDDKSCVVDSLGAFWERLSTDLTPRNLSLSFRLVDNSLDISIVKTTTFTVIERKNENSIFDVYLHVSINYQVETVVRTQQRALQMNSANKLFEVYAHSAEKLDPATSGEINIDWQNKIMCPLKFDTFPEGQLGDDLRSLINKALPKPIS